MRLLLAVSTVAAVSLPGGGLAVAAQVVTSASEPARPMVSETTGGAVVFADPRSCEAATRLIVWRVWRTPGGGTAREGIVDSDVRYCRWMIESLAPGQYEVSLTTSRGSGGRATFAAVAGRIVERLLRNPSVRVAGRVLMQGQPVPDVALRFVPIGPHGETSSVTTTADGSYDVMLDSPGPYHVAFDGGSLNAEPQSMTFATGRNAFDWDLSSGALTIRVMGDWDRSRDLGLLVSGPRATWRHLLAPGREPVVVVRGVPPGIYDVSALQLPGHTSRATIRATLDAGQQHVEVTVDVGESRSRLIVSDEQGRPLSAVSFAEGGPRPHGMALLELAPGVYALEGYPPGTQLRIRFGGALTPVCHEVPFDATLHVTAASGRRVELRTARPDATLDAPWTILGVNGSDCPVFLRDFVSAAIPTPPGQPPRFMLDNFPATGTVLLQVGRRHYEVAVSAEGVLTLPF
jgi:hypothetical protein